MHSELTQSEIYARACKYFGEVPKLESPTELRFGENYAKCVFLTGESAGKCWDYTAQQFIDVIDPKERGPIKTTKTKTRIQYREKQRDAVNRAIARSKPIEGTPVEKYLNSRGFFITDNLPRCIRFLPSPMGMLVIARTEYDEPLAVQLTQLTRDGEKDGSAPVIKRTMAAATNWHRYACARLPGKGSPILAEGVETGLSCWKATGRLTYVLLGNAGFDRLNFSNKRCVFAEDYTKPGSPIENRMKRARAARAKMINQLRIAQPPENMDFNDVHTTIGLSSVKRAIERAEIYR